LKSLEDRYIAIGIG